ncbi:hypothetical protein Pfo_007782 [Paulownia fortunei]|nr:hypothetical protein Pfo_007782 [Paulownia fortunei]
MRFGMRKVIKGLAQGILGGGGVLPMQVENECFTSLHIWYMNPNQLAALQNYIISFNNSGNVDRYPLLAISSLTLGHLEDGDCNIPENANRTSVLLMMSTRETGSEELLNDCPTANLIVKPSTRSAWMDDIKGVLTLKRKHQIAKIGRNLVKSELFGECFNLCLGKGQYNFLQTNRGYFSSKNINFPGYPARRDLNSVA